MKGTALKDSKSLHMILSAANQQIHRGLAGPWSDRSRHHRHIWGDLVVSTRPKHPTDECQQKRRNPLPKKLQNIHFMHTTQTPVTISFCWGDGDLCCLFGWWDFMGLMAEKGFCDMGDIACFISSIGFSLGGILRIRRNKMSVHVSVCSIFK